MRALVFTTALATLAGAAAACAPNYTINRDMAPANGGGGSISEPGAGGAGGTGGTGFGGISGTGGTEPPIDMAPPPPPPPVACGEIQPWMAEGPYKMGSKVTAGFPLHIFECRPWPNEGWCPMAAYEPAKADGPWLDAWIDSGPCPETTGQPDAI